MSDYIDRDAHQAGLAAVKSTSDYALANAVESALDNQEARDFFASIVTDTAEQIDFAGDVPGDDTKHEIADGAPDIYNHGRMMQLVGTRAYLDSSDIASGDEDILTLAGYVLYEIARRAVEHLCETYTEARDAFIEEAEALLEDED